MQYATAPSLNSLVQMHTDITAPIHGVDVITDNEKGILWVNVDGICVLRIYQIPCLTLNDVILKQKD